MHYKHLTHEERYHIYEGRAISKSLRKIAKELKRDVSTLSRETKRNIGERGYRPGQAHKLACERKRQCSNGTKIDRQVWGCCSTLPQGEMESRTNSWPL